MKKIIPLLAQASATKAANGNTEDLPTGNVDGVLIDVAVTAFPAGTAPAVTFYVDRLDANGAYINIYAGSAINAAGTLGLNLGYLQATNVLLGKFIRVRWVIGGTSSPSATFSLSVQGFVN